jgi:hypothetical protein
MTKIRIKDIYRLILRALPTTPDGNLLVEVENGKKITLYPPQKEGAVDKTAGMLKIKTSGIKFEDNLRRQEDKRLKREIP